MQRTRSAPAARIAGILMVLGFVLMPATFAAAADGREASASERVLIPTAGWQGRPIRDPHQHEAVTTAVTDRPLRGWAAGPVSLGSGSHRASGSQRVREVQWRLRALGYLPGPIDGIFGRRTRAAVGWFQVKHGFRVDGRATLAVVRHLRDRTTPGGHGGRAGSGSRRVMERSGEPTGPSPRPWDAYRDLVDQMPTGFSGGTDEKPGLWFAGFALLAFAIGFAAVAALHRSRPAVVAIPSHALPPVPRSRALGYVRVPSEQQERAGLEAQAMAIEARCARQGMALAGLVSDDDADDSGGRKRPGLAYALGQLERGEADCLVVGRLGHLARSPSELAALLDSMSERETPLVVLNTDAGRPAEAARSSGGRVARVPASGPGGRRTQRRGRFDA